jgi:hypothetical protein
VARQLSPAGVAMENGREAPFPISSSRMRAQSASASRVWITSGNCVARAAAM